MSDFKAFSFQYPVTAQNKNGKISLISTVTVSANAYFYRDGTVRTIDIIDVMDGDGNNIGSWIGFIESNEGNLNEVLEASGMAHAISLYEDSSENRSTEESAQNKCDPFDLFGSLAAILKPLSDKEHDQLKEMPY